MASWFTLTLDITPPTAEIFLPSITSQESVETITVVGSEKLDPQHEFYAIDSAGMRHNFTFTLQEDKKTFVGNVFFNEFSEGLIRFFFIIYDDVLNRSLLYVKNVSMGEAIRMNLNLLNDAMDSELSDSIRGIVLSDD